MQTSAKGRAFIEQFEGLFLTAYNDGVGVCTIGYGHTDAAGAPAVKYGDKITREEADEILSRDLEKVEKEVNFLLKVPVNQNQFDALVSFEFNTGALGRSTLLRKLNEGDYACVPTELAKWDHAGGTVMKGLARRRAAEGAMWSSNTNWTTPPVKPSAPTITPIPWWKSLLRLFGARA